MGIEWSEVDRIGQWNKEMELPRDSYEVNVLIIDIILTVIYRMLSSSIC